MHETEKIIVKQMRFNSAVGFRYDRLYTNTTPSHTGAHQKPVCPYLKSSDECGCWFTPSVIAVGTQSSPCDSAKCLWSRSIKSCSSSMGMNLEGRF